VSPDPYTRTPNHTPAPPFPAPLPVGKKRKRSGCCGHSLEETEERKDFTTKTFVAKKSKRTQRTLSLDALPL